MSEIAVIIAAVIAAVGGVMAAKVGRDTNKAVGNGFSKRVEKQLENLCSTQNELVEWAITHSERLDVVEKTLGIESSEGGSL
jgi:hypothetical protein